MSTPAYSYNANRTTLTFKQPYNLTDVETVVNTILDTTGYTFDVLCVYPISGEYGILPRALYYSLLAFSLVYRRHLWIATGCLAAAMLYAGTAAIHAFAIIVRYKFGEYPNSIHDENIPPTDLGDIDMSALWIILSSAAIMLTPIINWSKTAKDEKTNVRATLVWWGFLVFAGMICSMVATFQDHHPFMKRGLATCFENAAANCIAGEAQDAEVEFSPPLEFWQQCNCIDTCSAISDSVRAPFRTGTNLVPFVSPKKSMEIAAKVPFREIHDFNEFACAFIVVQGILGLIQSAWSQVEIRNWIFRTIKGRDFQSRRSALVKTTFAQKSRHNAAKWIALMYFICAVIFAIVCPAIFVINLVIHEIKLTLHPVSDPNAVVGQWGPWTSAGLVVVAALIQRYNSSFLKLLKSVASRITKPKPPPTMPSSQRDNSSGPLTYIKDKIGDTQDRIIKAKNEVGGWYQDPDRYSMHQTDPEKGNLHTNAHDGTVPPAHSFGSVQKPGMAVRTVQRAHTTF